MKDVTFSNGTYIPEGTIVAAITTSTHHDEENFENADAFDPFRFFRLREEGEITKHHYVSTSPANIGFGHGKHAWSVSAICRMARADEHTNIAPDDSLRLMS